MDQNREPVWVALTEVYNQEEAHLISGLLLMAGIPFRLEREAAGELYGLTVGPLAVIKITVPEVRLPDAQKILAGDVEEFEDSGSETQPS